jgi:hypothetical protein
MMKFLPATYYRAANKQVNAIVAALDVVKASPLDDVDAKNLGILNKSPFE